MFGDGGSVEARLTQMRTDRSLDSVTDSIGRLRRRLGLTDQVMVDDYLPVREVERRIQRAEETNASTPLPEFDQPAGVPEEYDAQ